MITIFNDGKCFQLDTAHTTYLFGASPVGRLRQYYYGPKIASPWDVVATAPAPSYIGFMPGRKDDDELPLGNPSRLPQEYSGINSGDLRMPALDIVADETGIEWVDLRFKRAKIVETKRKLTGLPQSFASKNSPVSQLQITLEDKYSKVEVTLLYTPFEECDVIARSTVIKNKSKGSMHIRRVMSAQLDLDERPGYELVTFEGHWCSERHAQRVPLFVGTQSTGSIAGHTGHLHSPAMLLCEPNATETTGEVYAMVLAYSGNHLENVEVDAGHAIRAQIGLNPYMFSWKLNAGDEFETPEAFLSFGQNGFGQISRQLHDFMRSHLIRSPWNGKARPILINNWEATYMDFDTQKIVDIAKVASKVGVEMLVLDDGWFGHRDDDKSSLGDWFENLSKIGSMKDLGLALKKLNMKFGLWFEPEMISEDSELYRKHPDWAIRVPGYPFCHGRNQLVLNMARPEIVDYLAKIMGDLIAKAKIDYIKWDMNRTLTDVYGSQLPADQQGEMHHRFVLGTYELHERLLKRFPNLLIEGCSGGGGRFDAGMLYYAPQIWCSDDTNAMDRLTIQAGTSMIYPVAAMGAHINAQPTQTRFIPFMTRGNVAMAGTFGFELDMTKLTAEELQDAKKLIKAYHSYHSVISEGDYYRLTDAFKPNDIEAWMGVSKDQKQAVITFVRRTSHTGMYGRVFRQRLRGLDPAKKYNVFVNGETRPAFTAQGDALMNCGIWPKELGGEDASSVVYLLKESTRK